MIHEEDEEVSAASPDSTAAPRQVPLLSDLSNEKVAESKQESAYVENGSFSPFRFFHLRFGLC